MANGAMGTDPKGNANKPAPTGPSKWIRVGPGEYRDQYGNRLRGQSKPPTRDMSKGKGQPAAAPTGPVPYTEMTREQQVEQGFEQGGQAYGDIVNRFRGFDPSQMQAQYQPQFQQEMDRYRQNIMGQFERRNAEEFQRQDIATQQQIAERGLDPNSPAAQALMKQNAQRQDLARQEAMSAAETGAYGIQEQAFGQAYKQSMLPYQQFEAISAPYMAGTQSYYQGQQLGQAQQFEAEQAALERKSRERIAGMSRGGGGGGGADPMDAFYDRQMPGLTFGNVQKPNPIASGVGGFVQGVGNVVTRGK